MRWKDPNMLFLLLLIPVVLVAWRFVIRRNLDALGKLVNEANFQRLVPGFSMKRKNIRFIMLVLSMTMVIIALARPQFGVHTDKIKSVGLDIMVLLDTSLSMNVEDAGMSRLQKGKHEVRTLLNRLYGDRVGIVAFAGSAELLVPLTTDYGFVSEYLESIDTGIFSHQGTSLGDALDAAMLAFNYGAKKEEEDEPQPEVTKVILVLSDGEDHAGNLSSYMDNLQKNNIRLFSIGVGSLKGGPIPIRDNAGGLKKYKKDRKGEIILSKANFNNLSMVAQKGRGEFFPSTFEEREIDSFLAAIDKMNRHDLVERKYRVYEERYQIFVALAVLFMALALGIHEAARIEARES